MKNLYVFLNNPLSGIPKVYNDIQGHYVSGNYLIVETKQVTESEGKHFLLIKNDVHDLNNVNEFTLKMETKKYDNVEE
jgi:hypothetical protein